MVNTVKTPEQAMMDGRGEEWNLKAKNLVKSIKIIIINNSYDKKSYHSNSTSVAVN